MVTRILSLKPLFIIAVAAIVSMTAREASAQIVMDGAMQFRMTRPHGAANWTTAATISKITNYDYKDYNGVQAKLVLAKTAYVQGKPFKAYVVSSSNRTNIPARTYLTNLQLSGYTSLPKGKWNVIMVLVNGQNQVLHGRTFPKAVGIRSAHGLSARALRDDTLSGHAEAE
jgi:hypothetical protein